jgi:hypothetical protein
VFNCPWEGVLSLYLITDRQELKPFVKQYARFRKRTASRLSPLGYLVAGIMKAALVITNDPACTRSDPREFRTNWGQFGRIRAVDSPTWIVATRRPADLRAALQQCPWAPPVEDHLPPSSNARGPRQWRTTCRPMRSSSSTPPDRGGPAAGGGGSEGDGRGAAQATAPAASFEILALIR